MSLKQDQQEASKRISTAFFMELERLRLAGSKDPQMLLSLLSAAVANAHTVAELLGPATGMKPSKIIMAAMASLPD